MKTINFQNICKLSKKNIQDLVGDCEKQVFGENEHFSSKILASSKLGFLQ